MDVTSLISPQDLHGQGVPSVPKDVEAPPEILEFRAKVDDLGMATPTIRPFPPAGRRLMRREPSSDPRVATIGIGPNHKIELAGALWSDYPSSATVYETTLRGKGSTDPLKTRRRAESAKLSA